MILNINKNKFILILLIIFILSITGCIIFFKQYIKKQKELKELNDNYIVLFEENEKYQTKAGIWVFQSKDYEFRIKDLKKNIDIRDSVISKLSQTLTLRDKKLKEVESVLYTTINSQNEGAVDIKDSVPEDEGIGIGLEIPKDNIRYSLIDDGFLKESLFIMDDTLTYQYKYNEEITIFETKRRKLTKNGNKAFFLIRWFRPWEFNTSVSSNNPKSDISATKIEINK